MSWKVPKDPGVTKRIAGTPLRLVVGLRPLTPLLPPVWSDAGPRDHVQLSLAPIFSVVTFPCELTPFVVPFAWAYTVSHALTTNQLVFSVTRPGTGKVRVLQIENMGVDTWGSLRLDDKLPFARSLVSRGNAIASGKGSLSDELSKYSQKFPMQAAQAVLTCLSKFVEDQRNSSALSKHEEQGDAINIVDFVRSTLPLWGGVNAMSKAYDGKRLKFAPWELSPQQKPLTPHRIVLDSGLRDKIDFVIETLVAEEETSESASMFYSPVTDDEAPSYSCAVPLGMSISKILDKLNVGEGSRQCYYMGIDSLLADVAAILDNCLLYNSPDSPVVDAAVEIVSRMKEAISKIAQAHYREVADAKKIDDDRRQHVLRQLAPGATGSTMEYREASRLAVVKSFKTPFKDPVDRDWLLRHPEFASGNTLTKDDWVPQAGDEILYSRPRHEIFVKGHYRSLEAEQCAVLNGPAWSGETPHTSSEWIRGTIQWTRPAFPKSLSAKSREDANTFETSAVLLSIGVRLVHSDATGVVYWRPCFVKSDREHGKASTCKCGLSDSESYLRPLVDAEPRQEGELFAKCDDVLSEARQEDICLLLDLLKRRCLLEIAPSFVDTELTKVTVKHGYKPMSSKGGLRNLQKYDHLLLAQVGCLPNSTMTTRGVPKKPSAHDAARERLAYCGFLPYWSGSALAAEDEKRTCETVVPLPSLCIELVQIRLRNGFYRYVAALENDLIESFVTAAVLSIRSSVSRKKSPVSMKRVARTMASNKGTPSANEGADASNKPRVLDEETDLADHLRIVRDLYATALVAVSDTAQMSLLLGLSQPVERPLNSMPVVDPEQDPARAEARQKLSSLLLAVGKDELQNTFPVQNVISGPTARLTLRCGGEIVSYTRKVRRTDHVVAPWRRKDIKVKFLCGGKTFHFDQALDCEDETSASDRTEKCDMRQVRETSIAIETSDFEVSDDLARCFFGRMGRRQPCARCMARRRSLLSCRVKRAHSNIDYDWASTFKGLGGIDGLLRALHAEGMASTSASCSEANERDALEYTEREPSGDTVVKDADDPGQVDVSDPREYLVEAEAALQLSRTLHREAVLFSEAPERLDKDFIEAYFPVDPSDGHYIYCIVCGLSGDLLCCDGCPNVLHGKCASLSEVPDGEWFCEECERSVESDVRKSKASPSKEQETPKSNGGCLPFGRVEFDDAKLAELEGTIQSIRDARPQRQKQTANGEHPQGSDGDGVSTDEEDRKPRRRGTGVVDVSDSPPAKRHRGIPRKNPSLPSDSSAPTLKKRGRGRPRKRQNLQPPSVSGSSSSPVKRGPGRPRKYTAFDEKRDDVYSKRGRTRERPDSENVFSTPSKRPLGRSKKASSTTEGQAEAPSNEVGSSEDELDLSRPASDSTLVGKKRNRRDSIHSTEQKKNGYAAKSENRQPQLSSLVEDLTMDVTNVDASEISSTPTRRVSRPPDRFADRL